MSGGLREACSEACKMRFLGLFLLDTRVGYAHLFLTRHPYSPGRVSLPCTSFM
jgi:hypothetical protein